MHLRAGAAVVTHPDGGVTAGFARAAGDVRRAAAARGVADADPVVEHAEDHPVGGGGNQADLHVLGVGVARDVGQRSVSTATRWSATAGGIRVSIGPSKETAGGKPRVAAEQTCMTCARTPDAPP